MRSVLCHQDPARLARGLGAKCCTVVLRKVFCSAVLVLREVLCAELVPPRPAQWKCLLVPPMLLREAFVREIFCAEVIGSLSEKVLGKFCELFLVVLSSTQ